MNLVLPLLLLALVRNQFPVGTVAPSLLGTWRLKSVHMVVQKPDGTPPYGIDAHMTFGTTTQTFTKKGHWVQRQYGNIWKEGTYLLHKGRLIICDSEVRSHCQVRELTVVKLVTITETTQFDGVHVQAIETYVR